MAKAVGQFTIIDLNDITISSTAPAVKIIDMVWLDTSKVPNQLKRWSGAAWVNAGINDADVDKKLENYSTTIEMNSAIDVAKDEITLSVEKKVISTYFQELEPQNPKTGEFWYKTENAQYMVDNMNMTVNSMTSVTVAEMTGERKLYRYNGTKWQQVEDSAIGDVQSNVTEIKLTTDSIEAAVNASKLTFDETGLTIKNGGFRILGANDEVLLSSENGNLELRAYLKTGDDVGAVYVDKTGIYFANTSGYGSEIRGGAFLSLTASAGISLDVGFGISISSTSISLNATLVSINGDLRASSINGQSCSWRSYTSLSGWDRVLTA